MIEFTLPDMTCGHCASTVTKTLKTADPACEVRIDLPTKNVQVQSAQERQQLVQALTEAGYAPA